VIVLKTRRQRLGQVVFTPDGKGLAAAGQVGAWWWKSFFDDPTPIRFGEEECGGIGFDPTGENLIVVHSGIGLRCLRLTDQSQHTVRYERFTPLLGVCPKTGLAVLGSFFGNTLEGWQLGGDGGFVRAWEVRVERGSVGSFVAFPGSGKWFVRAVDSPGQSPQFRLVLHDPATGGELRQIPARSWVYCTPAVSADGSRIAYGSQHFVYGHWTDNPERWVVAENDSTHQFTGLVFHPSGRYLATTNNDETVKLYDTDTWELAKTYTWDIGRMRSIAFSPDGTLAAAGSDTGKVVVWDVDV
jgi:WD40 repeat protein